MLGFLLNVDKSIFSRLLTKKSTTKLILIPFCKPTKCEKGSRGCRLSLSPVHVNNTAKRMYEKRSLFKMAH